MRLTVCLEGNTEGQVLASVDIEDVLKQCKEKLISKEAFEKMKSKSHRHGYRQGYAKAIDDFADKIISLCDDGEFMNRFNEFTATTILEIAEQLKAGGINE